jgi:hypothetical protein
MNIVHTIVPKIDTASQNQAYQAANFEDQAFALVDPASLAAKTQNATDEHAANQALKAQAVALVNAIDKRDKELDTHAQAEERSAMDDFAKQHGYASWKAMSDKHNPPAKINGSNTSDAPQPPPATNEGKSAKSSAQRNVEPKKPFDFLLKEQFNNGNCDFDLGYYERFGIKSGCKMAKAFEAQHKIVMGKEHFRPADQKERDEMKALNDAEFINIKRRAPRAKKL